MIMDARRLLAWTDLELRRRVGPARIWGQRLAIAGGLAALVGWRWHGRGAGAALATWHSIATVAFASAMLATALGMFWRHDAALLARLPIDGKVLLRAALVRAARGAVVCAAIVVAAGAPLAADAALHPALVRGLALVGTLTVAAAALIPAAAAAAALIIAGGQATRATMGLVAVATGTPSGTVAAPPEKVPTTALGALPGAAAAWMVILAITVRWWVFSGGETAVGPAPIYLAAAVGVSLLALAAVARKGGGMAVALREVAALDRQRLAHLEIHPPRGLEVVAMKSVGPRAGLAYSKYARLMRRRYPMAWGLGFLAWVVAIALAIGRPADAEVWAIGVAVFTAGYSVTLANRLRHAPIELARLAAQLPLAPALGARARVAWTLGYTLVFAVPPALIAAAAAGAWLVPGLAVGAGTIAAIAVARRGILAA
jgi:hypothetical protein